MTLTIMPRLPSDLIPAIVQEVGDVQSLKSCSLVASGFRIPSQRILRSLTLQATRPNYSAVWHFLEDSPHVAAYIVVLHIWVPKGARPPDVENLIQILDQLQHVRECKIGGNPPPRGRRRHVLSYSWTHVSAEVSSIIFGFLERQSLRRLPVVNIKKLSVSAFFRLVKSAPEITFNGVSILDLLKNSTKVTLHASHP
jgi:hypothetical protein